MKRSLSLHSILAIAMICHEANRAYCATLGDYSQPKWKDAPDWQKKSAVANVRLHAEDGNSTPMDSHNAWLDQKEKEGWKYGEVKHPGRQEHPCMVPFDQLPPEQQAKDYLFQAIVHSLVHRSPLIPSTY